MRMKLLRSPRQSAELPGYHVGYGRRAGARKSALRWRPPHPLVIPTYIQARLPRGTSDSDDERFPRLPRSAAFAGLPAPKRASFVGSDFTYEDIGGFSLTRRHVCRPDGRTPPEPRRGLSLPTGRLSRAEATLGLFPAYSAQGLPRRCRRDVCNRRNEKNEKVARRGALSRPKTLDGHGIRDINAIIELH